MMPIKKNDRLGDVNNESEWTFDCKTRGPDRMGHGNKPAVTWTCVLHNKFGERRFIPESKMDETFKKREAVAQ